MWNFLKKNWSIVLVLGILSSLFFICSDIVLSQEVVLDDATKSWIDKLVAFVMGLVIQYPLTATILIIMGTIRPFMKILCSAINTYVTITPSSTDNELWEKVKSSKYWMIFWYVIDAILSFKNNLLLPKSKPETK